MKRIISLTIAIVMLLSIFAGCQKAPAEEIKDSTAAETTVQAAEVTNNGDEPGWKKNASKPVTLDWYVDITYEQRKWGEDAISKYITKKTGVSVNLIYPSGNAADKKNTMIAAGEIPDLTSIGWWETQVGKLISGDMVWDLNEAADKFDPYFKKLVDESYPSVKSWNTDKDGHFYGFPNAVTELNTIPDGVKLESQWGFIARKDIYEALGKPDMTTPEGFLDTLKKVKEQYPDVTPLEFADGFPANGNYYFGVTTGGLLGIPREITENRRVDLTLQPDWIKWVKVWRQARELGYIPKEQFTDQKAQTDEKLKAGKIFSTYYSTFSIYDIANSERFKNDPNSVYIAVEGPRGSNPPSELKADYGPTGWMQTFVSKSGKNQERAMQFLTYMVSPEGQEDIFLGEEGVTCEIKDNKKVFKQEIADAYYNDPNFANVYGAHGSAYYFLLLQVNVGLENMLPDKEPRLQPRQWTTSYSKSMPWLDVSGPSGDTEEGQIETKHNEYWAKLQPKLLLAKTDADVDKLIAEYQDFKKSIDYEKVEKYYEGKILEAKKRMGLVK